MTMARKRAATATAHRTYRCGFPGCTVRTMAGSKAQLLRQGWDAGRIRCQEHAVSSPAECRRATDSHPMPRYRPR